MNCVCVWSAFVAFGILHCGNWYYVNTGGVLMAAVFTWRITWDPLGADGSRSRN